MRLCSFNTNRLLDENMIKSVLEIKMPYVKRIRHAQRSQEQITGFLKKCFTDSAWKCPIYPHLLFLFFITASVHLFDKKIRHFLFVDVTACLFPSCTDPRGPLKMGIRFATCSFSGINTNLFKSSLRAVSSSAATLRTLGLIPSVSYCVCYCTFYWSALKPLLLTLHFEAVFQTRFL